MQTGALTSTLLGILVALSILVVVGIPILAIYQLYRKRKVRREE